ncbi:MAG TPA: translation elongation factor Ts [Armatimonadetes bacterium]|nr:translation elongation factor Ts [Armatimonadota bacterium]
MTISASEVKRLRDETGAGMMDCKRALEAAQGDWEKAREILRQQGKVAAQKKAGRIAREGIIASYVHAGGQVAALVELNCETDFVARTEEFATLGRELAMQVAAMNPRYLAPEDVPEEVREREREILRRQEEVRSKPPPVQERIIEGRMQKFYEEVCLLEQPYIKDEKRKVRDLISEAVGRMGENIRVRRFVRLRVGEEE